MANMEAMDTAETMDIKQQRGHGILAEEIAIVGGKEVPDERIIEDEVYGQDRILDVKNVTFKWLMMFLQQMKKHHILCKRRITYNRYFLYLRKKTSTHHHNMQIFAQHL